MTVKPVKFPKVIDYIRFSFSKDKFFSSLRLEASAIFLTVFSCPGLQQNLEKYLNQGFQ